MLWFGSSAGVAVANLFPEARSIGKWLLHGWHIPIAYVAGFFVMLLLIGWNPGEGPKMSPVVAPAVSMTPANAN